MTKNAFRDSYMPQDGDICARRIREDKWEVSEWVGDLATGSWHEKKPVSLAELNASVRTQQFLGKHGDWEYYRKG
jgi:hypothetical protein